MILVRPNAKFQGVLAKGEDASAGNGLGIVSLCAVRWQAWLHPTTRARFTADARESHSAISFWPTRASALIAGSSSWPSGVSAYSADGGEVFSTRRVTSPRDSSSRSRALNTRAEMRG